MKTATVADLRNNFRHVSAWLDEGETVQIVKRGRPFARLIPETQAEKKKVVWPDFEARIKEIWGDRVFSDEEIAEMDAFEHAGEEGNP